MKMEFMFAKLYLYIAATHIPNPKHMSYSEITLWASKINNIICRYKVLMPPTNAILTSSMLFTHKNVRENPVVKQTHSNEY